MRMSLIPGGLKQQEETPAELSLIDLLFQTFTYLWENQVNWELQTLPDLLPPQPHQCPKGNPHENEQN